MASRSFPESPPAPAAPAPGSIEEYERRRCAICGSKYPGFGFGPPLTRPGTMLWACLQHRMELDRQLHPETPPALQEPRTTLALGKCDGLASFPGISRVPPSQAAGTAALSILGPPLVSRGRASTGSRPGRKRRARSSAQAIADTMGTTLLLAWSGESFMLSAMPIWVQQMAVGLSLDKPAV